MRYLKTFFDNVEVLSGNLLKCRIRGMTSTF